MARAFAAPRSTVATPVQAAQQNVAQIGLNILADVSERQITAEDRRQVTEATVAIERERQNLKALMRENASDPDAWLTTYTNDRQKIRDSIMSGVTQPGARAVIEPDLELKLQQWEGWLEDEAYQQRETNRVTSYETARTEFMERTPTYSGLEDAGERYLAAVELTNNAYGGGRSPVPRLAPDGAREAENRALARKIFGDWARQHVDGMDPKKAAAEIDQLNAMLEQQFGLEEVFGYDDLKAMKQEAKQAYEIAQAEADRKEKERQAALMDSVYTEELRELPYQQWLNVIKNTPGITDKEIVDATRTWRAAKAVMQETGEDPWKTTQDEKSLYQAQQDVESGEILNRYELQQRWMGDGQSPKWSRAAQVALERDLDKLANPSAEGYAETDPLVKPYLDRLDDLFEEGTPAVIPEDKIGERNQHRRTLSQLLEAKYPDVQAMQSVYDGYMTNVREEKAKSFVGRFFTGQIGFGVPFPSGWGSDPSMRAKGTLGTNEQVRGEDKVRMRNPVDGKVYEFSSEHAETAFRRGWRLVR